MRTCEIPGCNGKHSSFGWCAKHYKRWLAHGDPMKTVNAPAGAGSVCPERPGSTVMRRHISVNSPFRGRVQVREHIHLAEMKIGRRLLRTEVVHHIDGNPINNSPDNLAVMTRAQHGRLHSKEGAGCCKAVLSEADVIDIKKRLRSGESCKSISRSYGRPACSINNIRRGDVWSDIG